MKTLTRAEAIKALIAGKNIERVTPGGVFRWPLRWSDDGPQVQSHGNWSNECVADGHGYTYREVFTPRTFLCRWEEVQTFEEAEKANEDGMLRFLWCADEGKVDTYSDKVCFETGDCWVRRIPGK